MKLYHVSPPDRAASIAFGGLDPSRGLDTPGQVWFYTELRRANAHAGGRSVVWSVLLEDLLDAGIVPCFRTVWDDAACFVTQLVPPALLHS